MVSKRDKSRLLDVAAEINDVSAESAGSIAFCPRFMANFTFPRKQINDNEYTRKNGRFKLHIIVPSEIGLPYGSYPRRLLIYLTTELVITQSREINLDKSQAAFFNIMGIKNSGGAAGTWSAFNDQFQRLLSTTILIYESGNEVWKMDSIRVSNSAIVVWQGRELSNWQAFIALDESYFVDARQHAVPVDMRAINALSYYPLAMDVYCWLTHRYFNLFHPILIKWDNIEEQFGNNYKRCDQFKRSFKAAVNTVSILYHDAKYQFRHNGILLIPSNNSNKCICCPFV